MAVCVKWGQNYYSGAEWRHKINLSPFIYLANSSIGQIARNF